MASQQVSAEHSSNNTSQAGFWKRVLICTVIGFSSGLPLFVFLNLIPAWVDAYHLDIKTIGLLTLLQIPYVFKPVWAPFLDFFQFRQYGRRRTWLVILPVLLLIALGMLGTLRPDNELPLISLIGIVISFLSASLDIVIDAYRREILPDHELGLGNTIHVNAYKLAGLVPGSLAFILADHLPWNVVFWIVALFMLPCVILAMVVREPQLRQIPPRTLTAAFVEPLTEFFNRKGIKAGIALIAFIFFYKLGDSLATSLATKFYLDMGYTKTEIGAVAKVAVLWGGLLGGFVGGFAMLKLSIHRALWLFGVAQMLVIPLFAWLSMQTGQSLFALGGVVSAEAFAVGLGTAAFVAFIAMSTNPAYTAFQLALLTSLASLPRTVVNSYAGYMVDFMGGYTGFFWLCTLLALPGMLMLPWVAPWNEKGDAK
ncbi:MAG: MFS transporter [Gammaproteobacteria bacterium]|nr:MFS transporter [Gammaproteobacteria bacterium]